MPSAKSAEELNEIMSKYSKIFKFKIFVDSSFEEKLE